MATKEPKHMTEAELAHHYRRQGTFSTRAYDCVRTRLDFEQRQMMRGFAEQDANLTLRASYGVEHYSQLLAKVEARLERT